MIRLTQGNLLETQAEALVNTVNEVGVMGKGVALQVREAYPASAAEYMAAAKRGEVRVGRMLLTPSGNLMGPRWIIHFPTKKHWRHSSQLEWVRDGLQDLIRVVHEHAIRSVALPPLGCGAGGLDWIDVRREVEQAFAGIDDVDIELYAPSAAHQTQPKRSGVEALTPARALVAELVRRYGVLGLECSHLEVQKLAWFLQRAIDRLGLEDPLRLSFRAQQYGPYSDGLRHLLDALDGSYLHCERRLAEAGPLEPLWFDHERREIVAEYLTTAPAAAYAPALRHASDVIEGFESPLGMELLATVDWLLHVEGITPDLRATREGLARWPGGAAAARRKQRIFDDRLLGLALERLVPA